MAFAPGSYIWRCRHFADCPGKQCCRQAFRAVFADGGLNWRRHRLYRVTGGDPLVIKSAGNDRTFPDCWMDGSDVSGNECVVCTGTVFENSSNRDACCYGDCGGSQSGLLFAIL